MEMAGTQMGHTSAQIRELPGKMELRPPKPRPQSPRRTPRRLAPSGNPKRTTMVNPQPRLVNLGGRISR